MFSSIFNCIHPHGFIFCGYRIDLNTAFTAWGLTAWIFAVIWSKIGLNVNILLKGLTIKQEIETFILLALFIFVLSVANIIMLMWQLTRIMKINMLITKISKKPLIKLHLIQVKPKLPNCNKLWFIICSLKKIERLCIILKMMKQYQIAQELSHGWTVQIPKFNPSCQKKI